MAPAKQEQDIVVQIAKSFDGLEVDFPKLTKLVKSVCSRFRPSKATVSIAIVDDAEIRRVNKKFLSCDRPTDCMSFDLSDEKSRSKATKLFELVVNGERALKEAKLRGHSGEAELALYITHGLLHNLGFDDGTKAEAKKMHDTEDEILQELGYGLVYNKSKTVL
ncbi:MAG: rRNA maturation RNase YbeY [Sedimentisphaerales bacterium]